MLQVTDLPDYYASLYVVSFTSKKMAPTKSMAAAWYQATILILGCRECLVGSTLLLWSYWCQLGIVEAVTCGRHGSQAGIIDLPDLSIIIIIMVKTLIS